MTAPSRPTRPARRPAALPRLALALLVSAVLGVLLAGAAFPVVGGLGLAARAGAESFDNLPSQLKQGPLAQRTVIEAADGRTIATLFEQNRVEVKLGQVPAVVRQAILAVEDARFYEHNGIDIKGTLRAAVQNSRSGSVTQGGSTLTQQYVKNVLVEEASTAAGVSKAREQSIARKLQEARYALAIEKRMTKDQILEGYLNIAYFGSGAYGIGTAAQRYFSVDVSRLGLEQAALLAGIVKNPTRYDPVQRPEAAKERRDVALGRMAEVGVITAAQRDAAVAKPLGLRPKKFGNDCTTAATSTAFFCDYVREEFYSNPAFGATREDRQDRLFRGGLTIRTTLDPRIQTGAQAAVERTIPVTDPVATVSDVVEPGTGQIKAMAVNRIYGEDKSLNQTTLNLATGGSSGYQAGSTMKVFVLAEALRQGYSPSLEILSPNTYESTELRDCKPGKGCVPYEVSNAEVRESGTFDMYKATADSVNTYYIQLEERTGYREPVDLARRMGMTIQDRDVAASFVLGTAVVSPLDIVSAYATFAAHGRYCPPHAILSVRDAAGHELDPGTPTCRQALEPDVADTVTDILRGVITSGTGRPASIGRPAAGKTGTTQNFGNAWFTGYTPQLAATVWVGDPRGIKYPLRDRVIGGAYQSKVYGAGLPATVWRRTMSAAMQGLPVERFEAAPDLIASAQDNLVGVPDVRGLALTEATAVLEQAGFSTTVSSTRVSSSYPVGRVARTSPRQGKGAPPGSSIRIYRSGGRFVAPPASTAPQPTTPGPAPATRPSAPAPTKKPAKTPKQSAPGPPQQVRATP